MKTGRQFIAAILAALLLAAGAVALQATRAGASSACSLGTVSRLYLGQNTPDGPISEAQWQSFVAEVIAVQFPEGFTEQRGHGHWRDDRGHALEEQTRILEIAHADAPAARERVRVIAATYRLRFAQQSVLVTQLRSLQCFDNGA